MVTGSGEDPEQTLDATMPAAPTSGPVPWADVPRLDMPVYRVPATRRLPYLLILLVSAAAAAALIWWLLR